MNKVKVTLKAFEQVALNNDYEVFTPEEVAAYYKEGLMKSMAGQMDSANKEEFVSDIMHLQKAVVSDENGKETVRYYRKAQVKWEETANGIILKGLEGVYTDTPENRRLNRVGEAYVAEENVLKSILDNDEDILKAVRTGRYADTPENRRLHRVGQPYKAREKKAGGEEKEGKRKNKEDKENVSFSGEWFNDIPVVRPGNKSKPLEMTYRHMNTFVSRTPDGKGLEVRNGRKLLSKEETKNFAKLLQEVHKERSGYKNLDYSTLDIIERNSNSSKKEEKGENKKTINKNSSEDYKELEAYGKIPKDEKSDEGKAGKEDKKPEQKPENKDTSKSGDNEESFTRVKFDDIPNSGKVNLKKYLTPKRKAAADSKLGDLGSMDTATLKKNEKELVEKFNKDFDSSKKSQRAEDLYSIMKIKAELAKRGGDNDNKTDKKVSENKTSKKRRE